jgi:N-acetylmuramoyl-L-alanine amidase
MLSFRPNAITAVVPVLMTAILGIVPTITRAHDDAPAPVIVLDPGHGGSGSVGGSNGNNATGPGGTKEKDVILEVARETEKALKDRGYAVFMTRTDDSNLGLADRADVAKQHKARAFVAIHFNAWHDPKVQGTETLVAPTASDASKALAKSVQDRVLAVTGYRDRGVKPQELGVLRPERHDPGTAACLVEVSFLTDAKEEERLKDAAYKSKIGQAIAQGIADAVEAKRP